MESFAVMRIVAVDIGNTNINFAILKGEKVEEVFFIDTVLPEKELRQSVEAVCGRIQKKFRKLEGCVICSVVPRVTKMIEPLTEKILGQKTRVVGRDIKVPLKNLYFNPRQVGQDRLVCAYAAMRSHGAPVIVIDLGTAITLDAVSARNEYLGGIIVPGIRLSAESLYQKTALLPKTRIRKPVSLIGRDTEGSILSGIFYGYGVMIKGLTVKLKDKIGGCPKVVVTGGHTELMKKYIHGEIDVIDRDLVFKGMRLLWLLGRPKPE